MNLITSISLLLTLAAIASGQTCNTIGRCDETNGQLIGASASYNDCRLRCVETTDPLNCLWFTYYGEPVSF